MEFVFRLVCTPDESLSDKMDYHVFEGEIPVGRIYQTRVPGKPKWFWTVYGLASTGGQPFQGLADTLDEARDKLTAAWKTEKRQDS
jgi:hypothetical protein